MELIGRVLGVRRATPSAHIVRVGLAGASFSYRAGQAALIAPAGARERVPYSIASAPEDTSRDGALEFLIKHHAHGRWGNDFDPPGRGSRLAVRGPLGSFVFPERPTESRFLFIAGGTGISPLRSMLRHALAMRPASGGEPRVSLLYSARTPDDFAYGVELRGMARRGEISLVLNATRELRPRWRGWRGRIAPGQLALLLDDPATLCFVCGPAQMVDDVPSMLRDLGIDRTRIKVEEW